MAGWRCGIQRAYAMVMLAFIAQLAVAWFFVGDDAKEKVFLKLPLLTTSYAAVITCAVVGTVFMIFAERVPAWIGAIVCVLVTAYFILAGVRAQGAAEYAESIDVKVKAQTAFIRMATVDAQMLVERAASEEMKAEMKKVYEAIRYSDPMSSPALVGVEESIAKALESLKASVAENDLESAKAQANELALLIKERNSKCMMLK